MNNNLIIGVLFGDEGKGLVTNYLSSPSSLVCRFSGGHQAGHTVIENGKRHVFSNYGAGTLKGAPTYWSQFCTFEPIGFLKERAILRKKVDIDSIAYYLHKDSPITTPYDILANQMHENKYSHGSVGVGYGKTIERNEKLKFVAGDILHPVVAEMKLKAVREYYGLNKINEEHFLKAIDTIKNIIYNGHIEIVDDFPFFFENTNYVFEGSQGLLLDQDYGFFPHVTRGNVGTKRFKELGISNFERWYVMRAYQTRHGNGPMTNTDIELSLINNEDETNVYGDYQGEFRTSPLDLDLIKYALEKDRAEGKSVQDYLVITCLDQIKGELIPYTYENKLRHSNITHLIKRISGVLGFCIQDIYLSFSPESKLISYVEYAEKEYVER